MLRFCAVGVIMLQYSMIPFLLILYSWKRVPLGASTAETPFPPLEAVGGWRLAVGGDLSSFVILFAAWSISRACAIKL